MPAIHLGALASHVSLLAAGFMAAQEAPEAPAGGTMGSHFSVTALWNAMGPMGKGVAILLLLMSMLSIYVMIDRAIAFFLARKQSRALIKTYIDLVRQGNLKGALQAARASRRSHVAQVLKIGLQRATRKTPAVTMVAAWMSALTGVGPSIASGSQT